MATVLVVDDDPSPRLFYQEYLTERGYTVLLAASGPEAIEVVRAAQIDVVVLDVAMEGMDGFEALNKILHINNRLPVIINTSYGSYKDDFMTWAAEAYVNKSSDFTELRLHIEEALIRRGIPIPAPLEDRLTVFICHASQDKTAAREVCRRLKGADCAPWLDEECILPGQDWDLEIRRAIRTTDSIVVCLSSNSVDRSGYMQKEITFALDVAAEKPAATIFVIPAMLGKCDVPERLRQWQWVDLSEEQGWGRLFRALAARADELGRAPVRASVT